MKFAKDIVRVIENRKSVNGNNFVSGEDFEKFLYEEGESMKNVFYNDGGYTEDASELDRKIRFKLKDIIREELDKGSSIEAIEHVIFHAVSKEIMLQNMFKRNGKNVEGQNIDDFK